MELGRIFFLRLGLGFRGGGSSLATAECVEWFVVFLLALMLGKRHFLLRRALLESDSKKRAQKSS